MTTSAEFVGTSLRDRVTLVISKNGFFSTATYDLGSACAEVSK